MTATLKAHCPHCQAIVKVNDALVGKRVRCPACNQPFELFSVEATENSKSLETAGEATETMAQTPAIPKPGSFCNVTLSKCEDERALGHLGRFVLRELLGQGAFGRVYRAYDAQLDREVALKVPTFGPQDKQKNDRFIAEAKAAARLRHPNIVPTYESGQIEGQSFIASQFVPGHPLSRWIKKSSPGHPPQGGSAPQGTDAPTDLSTSKSPSPQTTPLSPVPPDFRQIADWVRQLADALAYAHQEGVVHRDIKPDNIMLDERNVPQIMDFGLAKKLNEDSAMTIDGSLLGTPAYMSPEQARGKTSQIGPASDQYSLGVVFFELLTGKKPFEGPPHAVIAQVIAMDPPDPRSLRPEIPRDLEAICQRAMSKEPAERYASANLMQADLARWLAGYETHARPLASPERAWRWAGRNRLPIALATAAILLLAVSLISVSAPGRPIKKPPEHSAAAIPTGATAQRESAPAQPLQAAALKSPPKQIPFPKGSSADILTADEWEWTSPENLGPLINSEHFEDWPRLSADGLTLSFFSRRNKTSEDRGNVWVSTRSSPDAPWTRPRSAKVLAAAGSPSLSADGLKLLFNIIVAGQGELFTISRASASDSWEPPVDLGPPINSAKDERDPFLSNDGRTFLFASNRPGSQGANLDLWMSTRPSASAPWPEPQNLGPDVNSENIEQEPWIAADQLALLFRVSADQSDIFMCTRDKVDGPWSGRASVSSVINTIAHETSPCLPADGRTLLFASERPGGQGNRDLWMSRRVRKGERQPLVANNVAPAPQAVPKAASDPQNAKSQPKAFPPDSSADILTSAAWEWTTPENLGPVINSEHFEENPRLSADGLKLSFLSRRPQTEQKGAKSATWISTRASLEAPWTPPVSSGLTGALGNASFSTDGLTAIFNKLMEDNQSDLFTARRASLSAPWSAHSNLGPPVNSSSNDSNSRLADDGCLLFYSSDRPGGQGKRDLWFAARPSTIGPWSQPENLGPNVNSANEEIGAWLTADKLTLLFQTAGGNADLWLSTRRSPDSPWSKRALLDSTINTSAHETSPCLSADGKLLFFASDRPGGHGERDLWMSRRVRKGDPKPVAAIVPAPAVPAAPKAPAEPTVASPPKQLSPGSSADILTSAEWEWTPPENLGRIINSEHFEDCPRFSADGLALLFNSRRPQQQGERGNTWLSTRKFPKAPWTPPQNAQFPGPGGNFWLSGDGLTLMRTAQVGDSPDIFLASRASVSRPWGTPLNLGLPVNSSKYEADPWLSSDGRTLLFSSNRPGGQGTRENRDLWTCTRLATDQTWSEPRNLGPSVNSPFLDASPWITADQLTLLFTVSSDQTDIFLCTRATIDDPWSERASLGPLINSIDHETCPCLSPDGQTLIFASDRPGGLGNRDLWLSHRVRKKQQAAPPVAAPSSPSPADPTAEKGNREGKN